jgi:hypothetical protein
MNRLAFGVWTLSLSLVTACGGSGSGGGAAGGAAGIGGVGASGGTGGTSSTGGSAGTSSGGTATGGSGGGTPGTWSVIENDSLYQATAIAGHPTDPSTIAILLDQSPLAPAQPSTLTVAISHDLGKTLTSTNVLDIPDTSYFDANGFVWSPADASRIAGAVGFPYGFDYNDLWKLVVSTNGGQSFTPTSVVQLERLKWDAGLLVGRIQGQFATSGDFGTTFDAQKPAPAGCNAASDYTQSIDRELFACGTDGLFVCQGTNCQPANLPSGTSASAVQSLAADLTRVVALAGDEIFSSSDGGKSFASVQVLPAGNWHLYADDRAGGHTFVVHDILNHAVWRSQDSGASFTDVTPSMTLPNTRGLSTYAYTLGITAGGGIAAYTAAGILHLP